MKRTWMKRTNSSSSWMVTILFSIILCVGTVSCTDFINIITKGIQNKGIQNTARTYDEQTKFVEPICDDMDGGFQNSIDYWKEADAYIHQMAKEEEDSVVLFETVSTESIEAAKKAERKKALDKLNVKYGKKYVNALFNEGKILVGTPEGLVRDHTNSELISEPIRLVDILEIGLQR